MKGSRSLRKRRNHIGGGSTLVNSLPVQLTAAQEHARVMQGIPLPTMELSEAQENARTMMGIPIPPKPQKGGKKFYRRIHGGGDPFYRMADAPMAAPVGMAAPAAPFYRMAAAPMAAPVGMAAPAAPFNRMAAAPMAAPMGAPMGVGYMGVGFKAAAPMAAPMGVGFKAAAPMAAPVGIGITAAAPMGAPIFVTKGQPSPAFLAQPSQTTGSASGSGGLLTAQQITSQMSDTALKQYSQMPPADQAQLIKIFPYFPPDVQKTMLQSLQAPPSPGKDATAVYVQPGNGQPNVMQSLANASTPRQKGGRRSRKGRKKRKTRRHGKKRSTK
jgi:hypothetical protein